MKTIGMLDEIHRRFKIISAITGKSLMDLMKECVEWLEEKYGSRRE